MLKQQICVRSSNSVVMRLVLFSTDPHILRHVGTHPTVPRRYPGPIFVKEATEKVLHLFPNAFHRFFPQKDMWNKSHALVMCQLFLLLLDEGISKRGTEQVADSGCWPVVMWDVFVCVMQCVPCDGASSCCKDRFFILFINTKNNTSYELFLSLLVIHLPKKWSHPLKAGCSIKSGSPPQYTRGTGGRALKRWARKNCKKHLKLIIELCFCFFISFQTLNC